MPKFLHDWPLINFFKAKITSCGCGYGEPHSFPCQRMFYDITRVFGEHMPNFSLFDISVWP